MWINNTEELAKHGFNFTWEQVKGKWATLIDALKRTNDHNNRSGADKKHVHSKKNYKKFYIRTQVFSQLLLQKLQS